ncbi:MAG TPA: HAD-IA family hydrolase [Caulobacteraceae bacterium]|jgi:putative hydrolase of the HAD superfamily|nr:HAD-IA family hydrolase [Caulobacteraceae bacterium]
MALKALMVDVDGVVIVHPNPGGWSANLERDLGVSAERLQKAFFRPHFADVVCGRAGLRERLTPVLREIAPAVTADALINYWFAEDAHLDRRLLDDLATLRAGGLELHLATIQEHERARYLWNVLGLSQRFDAIHYAAEIGWAKPAPEFFQAVEARTGFRGDEVLLIDDSARNVESARALGWRAVLWTSGMHLEEALKPHLVFPYRGG